MLVPGLRLEGSATRISSVQQYNDTVRVINGVTGGFGGTVTDSDSRTTTTGFTLSGGQLQGGLVWLFPFGNHRITVAPQMGFSVMSFEITSTNSAAAFTTSGIFGYEYAIGNVALAINARISHLATSEVSPITLLGGSFGLAYHISQ
jgi:hypothetical protein